MTKKVKCNDNVEGTVGITVGNEYKVVGEDDDSYAILNDFGNEASYMAYRFEVVEEEAKPIDSHYSFSYTLTQDDVDTGHIKVDPYFVAKQWALGSKDDTGVLFHCLKNISRYSDKNTKQREITALHLQIKRLAELEGVKLP